MSIEQSPLDSDTKAEPEIERGDFAPRNFTAEQSTKIVIATFNIRYAVGSFLITGSLFRRIGIKRPARRPRLIEHNIRQAAQAFTDGRRMPVPDVIALQEADRKTLRAGGRHVAREMAEKLRMNYVHTAAEVPHGEPPKSKQWYLDFEEHISGEDTGDTGVAILSRLPFEKISRIDLPWFDCPWRPRLALGASVRITDKRMHIYNAHIDPHASTRQQLAQHEAILAHAEESGGDGPIVLLGDFNTLTSPSRFATRSLLESRGFQTPLPTGTATWRAGLYRLHADWIFTRGVCVTRWGVARPLSVSDHWPVWAEIDLGKEDGSEANA